MTERKREREKKRERERERKKEEEREREVGKRRSLRRMVVAMATHHRARHQWGEIHVSAFM